MKINVKRAYDKAGREDGFRVLVDRLWPRGISKEKAKLDMWAKEAAPSAALRSWFHEDREDRFVEFSRKYGRELAKSEGLAELKAALKGKATVTLVTGARDVEHSHVPTLMKHISRR